MNWRQSSLFGVAILLGILVVLDRSGQVDGAGPIVPLAVYRQGQAEARSRQYLLANFDDILRHPLFRADRKAEPDIAPDGPGESLHFDRQLVGIVSGKESFAVLRDTGGKTSWVTVGQQANGWTLAQLDLTKAVFARGAARQVVHLTDPQLGGATGATTPWRLDGALAAHPIIPTDAMLEEARQR